MAIEVSFDVPMAIAQGLGSGQLERVGGVIRNTKTKEIVGWLREASTNTSDNPLSDLIRKSGVVHLAASANLYTQLINVGFTAVSFSATMNQLQILSEEINSLGELIQHEFWRDRDKDFEKALDAARNAFESNIDDKAFQREMASAAILELPKARNLFLDEFEKIAGSPSPNKILMEHCLIRAFHAHTTLIKCLVLHDQAKLARERMKENMDRLRKDCQLLVQMWVSTPAAVWFHQNVPLALTRRYVSIQRWLRASDNFAENSESSVLWDVLNEARVGFWNNQVLQFLDDEFDEGFGGIGQRIARTPKTTRNQKLVQLASNIAHAEMLIESDQRLAGYSLELSTMRLSYPEWESRISIHLLEENGSALLVDTEALQGLS